MSATAVKPAPPGVPTRAAPAPDVCPHCDGTGVENDEDAGRIICLKCGGIGVGPVEFNLPPARTHAVRRVRYVPLCGTPGSGLGRVELTVARKPGTKETTEAYWLAETTNDWRGRSFAVVKAGHPDRVHHVFLGVDAVRCDCEGTEYHAAAKANQRAHQRGEETYPTYGCRHADFCAALLVGGWFDL